jgi:diaminopimelate decarboxylase
MSTPFDHFSYKNGELCAESVPLSEIAKRFGTPLYVYSKQAFLEPLRELRAGLQGLDHLICFAVKANSNLAVLSFLSKEGAGMDLVSGGEMMRALKVGVDSSKIVFSGVGKTDQEISDALNAGILAFNVESVAELGQIDSIAARRGKKAPVSLRFNPDVDPKTHPYISTGLKKNKFGLQRAEIMEIIARRKSYPNLTFVGISIHIGSQILDLTPFEDAFRKTKRLILAVEKAMNRKLSFVDLGGGVGIRYSKECPPKLSAYTRLIHQEFGKESEFAGRLRILLEPGRTIAGNAGVLVSKVLHRKPRKTKDFIVIDAGMNDLIRPSLYGSHHGIAALSEKREKGEKRKSDIVGPVCESSDVFAENRLFPVKAVTGDLIAILSAGAYGMSMGSQYNTRPRPAEVLVDDEGFRLIRKRESFEDLIRNEVLK